MEFGSEVVYATKAEEYEELDELEYFSPPVATGIKSSGASNSKSVKSTYKHKSNTKDDGQTCLLDILDTAGQEEYSCMRDQYTRSAQCFLIVFSVTDQQSLRQADSMYRLCQRIKDEQDVPAVLAGNKTDLVGDRQVSTAEGAALAQSLGIGYVETSAKAGTNVLEAFEELIRATPRTGIEYKLCILGSGGVGKSSLCTRFISGHFGPFHMDVF